jgi:hypothetical protein
VARLSTEVTRLSLEESRLSSEGGRLETEAIHLRGEIHALRSTATWRLRERLLRLTPLVRAYRLLRGSDR